MTNFVWREQVTTDSPSWVERIRSWVWKCAIATLLLMMVGSATRVMDAGLACPDWPLCYGQLVPNRQMNFQVFLEWFHRLDAALIGLSTLILAGVSWWQRRVLPNWLPWATTFALFAIVWQAILGGLTVTELLRFDIVTAHLATAMLFFSTLVAIGTMLSPDRGTGSGYHLAWLSATAGGLVYLQSLLGGLVASRWAVHQCLGISQLCAVMDSHIAGVLPTTLVTASLIWLAWRTPALHLGLRQLTKAIACLLLLQIILGLATFWFRLQVEPLTVAHHTIGVTLLGTLVAFTVLAVKDRQAVAM
jgi:heme a synthase